MVTPENLTRCAENQMKKMVKKIVLSFTAEKKNCLLLIRSEKNCTFKLGVEKKSLITKEKPWPPPRIKWSAPKRGVRLVKVILYKDV